MLGNRWQENSASSGGRIDGSEHVRLDEHRHARRPARRRDERLGDAGAGHVDDVGALEQLGQPAEIAVGALDTDPGGLERRTANAVLENGDDADVDALAVEGERVRLHCLLGPARARGR